LSASALKAWFDKSAMMLKDKLNALISALGSTDALDNILVTVEEAKEPISAKEWVESILNIEIDGEDKTIHDWLEQLSAFVNALNDTIYGSGNVPDESKEGSLIIRVLKLEQDKVDNALISKEIPSSGSDNSIPTVSAVRKNLKDSVANTLGQDQYKPASQRLLTDNVGYLHGEIDGLRLSLELDEFDYIITATLKDSEGNELGDAQTINLPIESLVMNAATDENGDNLILTLRSGNTLTVSLENLIRGLVTKEQLEKTIAPDLSGNEEDKAPSVKAVNEELAKKQDNIGLVVVNNEICMIIQEDE
jgi:hypothetical protein